MQRRTKLRRRRVLRKEPSFPYFVPNGNPVYDGNPTQFSHKPDTIGVIFLATMVAVASHGLPGASTHPHSIRQIPSSLDWGPCISIDQGFVWDQTWPWGVPVCANFTVPLDWTNPSDDRTATLYVQKNKAKNGSPLGTIFTNPGGPGASGILFLSSNDYAGQLYNITEGAFDIISWDHRGTGFLTPRVNCFDPAGEIDTSQPVFRFLDNLLQPTLQSKSSGPSQSDIDRFFSDITQYESLFNSTFVEGCARNENSLERSKYFGTVATVKDLVALADAAEGPGSPINYWGFGYGTVIGSHLLDLYPSRVSRMVLDGVVDAESLASKPAYQTISDSLQDAEGALQAFYNSCAAVGPYGCDIGGENFTSENVKQRVYALIDGVYAKFERGDTVPFNTADVRWILQGAAGTPSLWEVSAGLIQGLETILRDGTLPRIRHKRDSLSPVDFLGSITTLPFSIWCGDSVDNRDTTTKDVFEEIVRVTKEVSNVFGPLSLNSPPSTCHLWPVRAIERHTPLRPAPTLQNPVLVIGNTYDVMTPLESAKNLVNRLNTNGSNKQAVLIQHDGAGHTSLEMYSACTWEIVGRYFIDGIVPEDTLCGTNFGGMIGLNPAPATSVISLPLTSATATGLPGTSSNGSLRLTSSWIKILLATGVGMVATL